jgi:hypothetical protein
VTPAPRLVPRPPDELEAIHTELASCERKYLDGDAMASRGCFVAAWERLHPNPLALVMAAHAARAMADVVGAKELLARARQEATASSNGKECARPEDDQTDALAYFDHPNASWLRQAGRWLRTELGAGRPLYGFCGTATRDPAVAPGAPVTWAPSIAEAEWEHPPRPADGSDPIGLHIVLRDAVFHRELGSVALGVAHFDYNEEYHGHLAFSADRTLMAAVGNLEGEPIRIWRVADGALLRELPRKGNEWLDLSPDGSLLAAGSCNALTVWEVATGTELGTFMPPHIACSYGAGPGSPFLGAAFSKDGKLLAVGVLRIDMPSTPMQMEDAGPWIHVYRLRGGTKALAQWHQGLAPLAVSSDAKAMLGYVPFAGAFALLDPASDVPKVIDAGTSYFVTASPWGRWLLTGEGAAYEWIPPQTIRAPAPFPQLEEVGVYWIPNEP